MPSQFSLFLPACPMIPENNDQSFERTEYLVSRINLSPTCYVLPSNASDESIKDVLFACAVACTSDNGTLSQYKNLITTYTNCIFNGILRKVPKHHVVQKKITENDLKELATLRKEIDVLSRDPERPVPDGIFARFKCSWDLPQPSDKTVSDGGIYCRTPKTLYAHYSLVAFLAGILITDSNRKAITQARPKALIEKFKIECTSLLNGHLKMSDHSHSIINQAWFEMSSFKSACFIQFCTYSPRETNLVKSILNLSITPLRYSQMQHVPIIKRFLKSYPWACHLPELRQSYASYKSSMDVLLRVQDHFRPYVKIIHGDKCELFPRRELGPLIACALFIEREVNPTLINYYSNDAFAKVVDSFNEVRLLRNRRDRTKVTGGSKIAVDKPQ